MTNKYYPGYAETGSYFALNIEAMLSPDWGLTLLLGSTSNSLNTAYYSKDYGEITLGGYVGSSAEISSLGNYSLGEYLIGITHSWYTQSGGRLQAAFSLGIASLTTPSFGIVVSSLAPNNTVVTGPPMIIPAGNSTSFGCNFTIRYSQKIYKSINATFSCTYTGSITDNSPLGGSMLISLLEPSVGLSSNL